MAADNSELIAITKLFKISGKLLSIAPHGSGHINKTYLSTWSEQGINKKYIHQTINQNVFKDVAALMQNISTVLEHFSKTLSSNKSYGKLQIIPSIDGTLYAADSNSNIWRTYNFLENSSYYETCTNNIQAKEAGRIVGFFQRALTDLSPNKLAYTIINFTSSSARLKELEKSIKHDRARRLTLVKEEVDFVKANAGILSLVDNLLKAGDIPERIIHGDTKLNNICFDEKTGSAVCLIDLDTCMPGYSLYDFGDLVRNVGIAAEEDEQDFSKISFDLARYTAILEGYAENAKFFLNKQEIKILHLIPQLLALTLGIRFLSDFLNGDLYFSINRKFHNLERARTQFKIYETFKARENEMAALTASYF